MHAHPDFTLESGVRHIGFDIHQQYAPHDLLVGQHAAALSRLGRTPFRRCDGLFMKMSILVFAIKPLFADIYYTIIVS